MSKLRITRYVGSCQCKTAAIQYIQPTSEMPSLFKGGRLGTITVEDTKAAAQMLKWWSDKARQQPLRIWPRASMASASCIERQCAVQKQFPAGGCGQRLGHVPCSSPSSPVYT